MPDSCTEEDVSAMTQMGKCHRTPRQTAVSAADLKTPCLLEPLGHSLGIEPSSQPDKFNKPRLMEFRDLGSGGVG